MAVGLQGLQQLKIFKDEAAGGWLLATGGGHAIKLNIDLFWNKNSI